MVTARYQDRKLLAMSKSVGELFNTAASDLPTLWSPIDLGALKLKHRIVLAPMTRNRVCLYSSADSIANVQTGYTIFRQPENMGSE